MATLAPEPIDPRLPDEKPQGEFPPADGAGDSAEQREFELRGASGRDRLRFSRANIVLVGLFLAGAAGVYLLSLRGKPEPANANDQAAEQQVEGFIQRATQGPESKGSAESADDTRKIVEAFYQYASQHQVPLEELRADPFAFGDPATSRPVVTNTSKGPSPEEIARTKRRAEIDAEFTGLKLQSIMMGPLGGTAIINSNVLTEGQQVGSFKVAKIQSNSVDLVWNTETFTLRIRQ